MAGIIRNKDDKSDARYRSVARGARLIGMKVLDEYGSGYSSTVMKAIEFAIANKSQLKIDVINLSLGHPIYEAAATDPLVQAVERAVAAGIVVVVASGNEGINRETGTVGYAGIASPGNAPSAISVGAVDTKNTLTRTDDESPPSVLADRHVRRLCEAGHRRARTPRRVLHGEGQLPLPELSRVVRERGHADVHGAEWNEHVSRRGDRRGCGCYSSEPVSNNGRTPTPNTVKAILQFTATDVPGADTLSQGAGSINAAGAITLAGAINTGVPEYSWWLTRFLAPLTTLSNGEMLNWAQRVVWGDRLVWGIRFTPTSRLGLSDWCGAIG